MVVLPNGERHWPLVGAYRFREVADIRQYQLIQHALGEIEVRLVADRPLSSGQEAQLAAVIHSALGYPFTLRFTYSNRELPKTAGGKFEEFISLVG